jgi:2-octaprenyl-6-methoxyphenol hydroxylase
MPAAATDFLVRGAGPVGCVAALALRAAGRSVALVGNDSSAAAFRPAVAFRPLVLSYASRLILERLGVWSALATTPIESIHVSQARHFGRTVFDAGDAGVPALGYVLEYSALLRTLRTAAEGLVARQEPDASCVVHAEGTADAVEKRYAQDAVVAAVRFAPQAASRAYERFTAAGPLALLPLAGRYAVVWSLQPERAKALVSASEKAFLEALQAEAGSRPGRPLEVESRAVQPLVLRVRETRTGDRSVYIGNAAQTLHPVAGQGLNLGLRDAWDLAQVMRGADDPGSADTLSRFAARRRLDAGAAIRATDLLATMFLKSNPVTSLALTALDVLPAPRRFFARRMIFGPSALP